MPMKNDTNQGLLLLSYGTRKGQEEFIEECRKKKLGLREWRFFDLTIPVHRYDEIVNWLKHLCSPIAQRLLDVMGNNIFLKSFIKKIEKKAGYKMMDIDWSKIQRARKIKGKYALLTPVACEWREGYRENCSTEEEKENYDKLYKFESKGYKPKTLKEQGIFKPKDMDMSRCNKNL